MMQQKAMYSISLCTCWTASTLNPKPSYVIILFPTSIIIICFMKDAHFIKDYFVNLRMYGMSLFKVKIIKLRDSSIQFFIILPNEMKAGEGQREKHNYQICLASEPTLPLSIQQLAQATIFGLWSAPCKNFYMCHRCS